MAKVFFSAQAQKDFKRIPQKDRLKIQKKLTLLENDSLAGKKLAGKLKEFYSLRIWPYRAIYLTKGGKEIWVVHILHRQKAYK